MKCKSNIDLKNRNNGGTNGGHEVVRSRPQRNSYDSWHYHYFYVITCFMSQSSFVAL